MKKVILFLLGFSLLVACSKNNLLEPSSAFNQASENVSAKASLDPRLFQTFSTKDIIAFETETKKVKYPLELINKIKEATISALDSLRKKTNNKSLNITKASVSPSFYFPPTTLTVGEYHLGGNHVFFTSATNEAASNPTWQLEYAFTALIPQYIPYNPSLSSGNPVYRIYNVGTLAHLFTEDRNEFLTLINIKIPYQGTFIIPWHSDGIAFNVPSSGNPMYRYYNQVSGDYYFSQTYLPGGIGNWAYEELAWYLF